MRLVLLCCLAFATTIASAHAGQARCFTTDDGQFDCSFRTTDDAGSFQISAPGRPTYAVEIDRPGVAYGFVNLGARNIPLPGMYERQSDDPACWANADTGTKICAW